MPASTRRQEDDRQPYPRTKQFDGVPRWWVKERIEEVGRRLDALPEGERFLPREDDHLRTLDEAVAFFRFAFRYSRRTFRELHKPLLRKYAHGEDSAGRLRNQLYYESQIVAAVRNAKAEAQPIDGPGVSGPGPQRAQADR